MLARVGGLLEPTLIDDVELFFDDEWRMLERIYRLKSGLEGWNFLEIGFEPHEDGTSEVEEVRLMREIKPESAPTWSGTEPPQYLTYDDMMFRFVGEGGGNGVIIDADNQYRLIGTSRWVTYQAELNGVTYLLVYSRWEGGSGVYTGQLVPQDDACIRLVEAAANSGS